MPCIANLPRVGDRGYVVQGYLNGQPLATPQSWMGEARVTQVNPFHSEGMQITVSITRNEQEFAGVEIHRSEWSTDTPLPEPE